MVLTSAASAIIEEFKRFVCVYKVDDVVVVDDDDDAEDCSLIEYRLPVTANAVKVLQVTRFKFNDNEFIFYF